jgi:flagellar hook assembly protein FlgD
MSGSENTYLKLKKIQAETEKDENVKKKRNFSKKRFLKIFLTFFHNQIMLHSKSLNEDDPKSE